MADQIKVGVKFNGATVYVWVNEKGHLNISIDNEVYMYRAIASDTCEHGYGTISYSAHE